MRFSLMERRIIVKINWKEMTFVGSRGERGSFQQLSNQMVDEALKLDVGIQGQLMFTGWIPTNKLLSTLFL